MTPEEHAQQLNRLESLQTEAVNAIAAEHASEIGASWLRKRFHIDYTTAVHLMDRLELAGNIGPVTDAPLRSVLGPAAALSIFD